MPSQQRPEMTGKTCSHGVRSDSEYEMRKAGRGDEPSMKSPT